MQIFPLGVFMILYSPPSLLNSMLPYGRVFLFREVFHCSFQTYLFKNTCVRLIIIIIGSRSQHWKINCIYHNILSASYFNTNFSRNLIWYLFFLIISCVDKVVFMYIANATYFIALSFSKNSSLIECHVLWTNNFICVFITSIARQTYIDWLLE